MDSATQAEIFMVAERAVGQAAQDLRSEFGLQMSEIRGSIEKVKEDMAGGLNVFRDTIQQAFVANNKTLRADISNSKDLIVDDLVEHYENYSKELGNMLTKTNEDINNKLKEKD